MYWLDRIQKQNEIINKRSIAATDKKLAELYRTIANEIILEIKDLYDSLNKPYEEVLPNDLYRNNRYFDLLNSINQKLRVLGLNEINVTDSSLLEMHNTTQSLISSEFPVNFTIAADDGAEVLNTIWCGDGKHWSDRIWTNKREMENRLIHGLTDCVTRGLPKDKVVEEMTRLFNIDFNKADRLVRTELTYVQNATAAKTYEKAGCTCYEYLCKTGNDKPDECDDLNGKVFKFSDKKIGENFPPMHPNCRCTILPVVED